MKNNSLKSGFTIIEVIVILFVMSMGLIGVLSLIVQNIQSQSYNKSNLIAYQLAQEGVELIRKVRDSNWRAGLPYDDKLADGQYFMDYTDTAPQAHNSANPDELILRKDASDFYTNNPLEMNQTIFSRLITIAAVDSSALRVVVTISWSETGRNYNYDLETILYNWR